MHLVLTSFCACLCVCVYIYIYIFFFFFFFSPSFLVSNLALVKPEKTKAVENYLIQMARYGQLSGKVSLTCLEAVLICCYLLDQNVSLEGQFHLFLVTEFLLKQFLKARIVSTIDPKR